MQPKGYSASKDLLFSLEIYMINFSRKFTNYSVSLIGEQKCTYSQHIFENKMKTESIILMQNSIIAIHALNNDITERWTRVQSYYSKRI